MKGKFKMIDCINNSQPAQATIVYKNGSVELVNNVTEAYINENTYVIQSTSKQSTSKSIILTLSEVIKIEMKMMRK